MYDVRARANVVSSATVVRDQMEADRTRERQEADNTRERQGMATIHA